MQSSIYDKFVAKAKALAEKRTVGDPWTNVEQGPQVDNKQFDKILDLIDSGKKEGAKLECGGKRARDKGYFVQVDFISFSLRIFNDSYYGNLLADRLLRG